MAITASIVGSTFITVMMNGATHTINADHPHYNAIRDAVRIKDHVEAERLINIKRAVETYAGDRVRVVGNQVFYGDMEVKGSVVNRILAMISEGFDADPMVRFLENLMANPSKRAVDELYGFLEATKLPITEDGCFLAYKKVNDNYRDFYTGKMDNSVGQILEMPRNQVDDDKDQTCSHGLHFCSLSYLPHYHGGAGRVLIVKINPADVVSIPSDYNNAKGRACRYEVVDEYHGSDRENLDYFTSSVYSTGPGGVTPYGSGDEEEDDTQDDYDNGYEAGTLAADKDSDALRAYNDTVPPGSSEAYADGYQSGYQDNYHVDWEEVGYERAESDVEAGKAYDDTPVDGCEDSNEYRTGYANGWRDTKINRI